VGQSEEQLVLYAPSLDKIGALAGYVRQQSHFDLGTKTLDPVTGFWVSRR
jgi:hypothetical protein